MRPIDLDHDFPRTSDITSDADADTYAAARAAALEAAAKLGQSVEEDDAAYAKQRKRKRKRAQAVVPCRMCGGVRFRSGGLCQDCFSPNLIEVRDGERTVTVMTSIEAEAETRVDRRSSTGAVAADVAADVAAIAAADAAAAPSATETVAAASTIAAIVEDRLGHLRRRGDVDAVDAELAAMDTVPMPSVAEPVECVPLGTVGSDSQAAGSDADLPVPEFVEDDANDDNECGAEAEPMTLLERVRDRKRRRGGRRGVAGVMAAAGDRIKGHLVAIAVHAVAILAIWSLVVAAEELEKAGMLGIAVSLDKPSAKMPTPAVDSSSDAADSSASAAPAASDAMPTESPRIPQPLERPTVHAPNATTSVPDGLPQRDSATTSIDPPFDDGVSSNMFGQQFREGDTGGGIEIAPMPTGPISLFGNDVPGQRILFVIDASTSMATPITTTDGARSTRWEHLQRELLGALEGMLQQRTAELAVKPEGEVRFAFDIVCYHHDVSSFAGAMIPPTEAEIEHAREWLSRIAPAGATNWKHALTEAYSYADVDTLYFLSDGWPNYPDPNTDAGQWENLARERRAERDPAFAFVGTQYGGYSGLSPQFEKLIEVSAPNAHASFVSDVSARPGQLAQFLRLFTDDPELVEEVFEAIDDGTKTLMREQKADGSFADTHGYGVGAGALALLAMNKAYMTLYPGTAESLRHEVRELERLDRAEALSREQKVYLDYLRERAGDEAKLRDDLHRAIEAGMDWVRDAFDGTPESWPMRTYTVGIVLMLMEAYYTRVMPTPDGYALALTPHDLRSKDRRIVRELAKWLEERYEKAMDSAAQLGYVGPFWSYGEGREGMGDNSNAQYAILGLKAAAKLGVHVNNDDLWRDVARYYLDTQDEDGDLVVRRESRVNEGGKLELVEPQDDEYAKYDRARGWGYFGYASQGDVTTTNPDKIEQLLQRRRSSTASMTTAGLGALLVAQSELYHAGVLPFDRKLDAELDQAIYDGMAKLGQYRMRGGNYFLYGAERVGAFARVDHFGQSFWYIEGVRHLLDSGRGRRGRGSMHDSAFALLFLARGTAPVQDMREPMPPEAEDGE